jgi:hypothetical protein
MRRGRGTSGHTESFVGAAEGGKPEASCFCKTFKGVVLANKSQLSTVLKQQHNLKFTIEPEF